MTTATEQYTQKRHQAWCESCVWNWHPTVLSGYFTEEICDNCGCSTRVALISPPAGVIPLNTFNVERYLA